MRDWLQALHDTLSAGSGPVVRVVVAVVRGSAPREPGASMLVTACSERGSIGGGHLELVATRLAREMLLPGAAGIREDRFPLAASLGQCCGGIVELWFERYEPAGASRVAEALRLRSEGAGDEAIAALASRDARALRYERFRPGDTPLWLFGAGHVGRALVNILAPLPFAITWIDSREGFFPGAAHAGAAPPVIPGAPPSVIPGPAPSVIPGAAPSVIPGAAIAATARDPIERLHASQPADEVSAMPPGAWALVMTHSHDEDLVLCEALLAHGTFGWAGVIGSRPKATRFRQKLAQRGFDPATIARLTMPIGIGGIGSKEPAAIAVAVAAQLLQLREARAAGVQQDPLPGPLPREREKFAR